MTDLKRITINMVTLGILIFSIMSFIIIIQSDSNLDEEDRMTNNTFINDSYGNLEANLSRQTRTENSLDSLGKSPPQNPVGELDVGGMVSSTTTARAIITGVWNIYVKLPMAILGVDPIVSSAITTILLILIAVGIWAIWKGAIS